VLKVLLDSKDPKEELELLGHKELKVVKVHKEDKVLKEP
jgi:hypothetical protein